MRKEGESSDAVKLGWKCTDADDEVQQMLSSNWKPSPDALCQQVAINNEVLAAMSNINYAQPGGMLDTWMESVKRCGIKNAMVIALDAQTTKNAEAFGIPAFEMHMEARHQRCSISFPPLLRAPCLMYCPT